MKNALFRAGISAALLVAAFAIGMSVNVKSARGSSYAIAFNGILSQCDQPAGVNCGPS